MKKVLLKKFNKKILTENYLKIMIIIIIIISFIPIIKISCYNHPSADDYGYSDLTYNIVKSGGNIFDIIKTATTSSIEGMKVWQGLYSSGFLLALQPSIFGERYYALVPFVIIGTIALGIGTLLKNINKYIVKSNHNSNWFILTCLLTFFFVQTIPSAVEGLFWFNGAVNYLFFISLLFFYVSTMIRYLNNEKNNRVLNILIGIVSAFVMSGGNHVTAFLSIMITLSFLLYTIIRKKCRKNIGFVFMLLAAIGGFIINMMAPGTSIRKASIEYKGNILETIIMSIFKAAEYLNNWTSFSIVLLLVIVTPFLFQIIKNSIYREKFKFKYSILFFILSYGILCTMLCVPYYAMGSFGAGRLENTIYITFLVLFILNYGYLIGVISNYLDRNKLNTINLGKTHKIIFGIFVIAFMSYITLIKINGQPTTFTEAISELKSGEAQEYDRQLNNRVQVYLNEDYQNIEVDKLTVKPKLLYFEDITDNPKDWKNKEISIYYHKETIVTK